MYLRGLNPNQPYHMRILLLLVAFLSLTATGLDAQIRTPAPSPSAKMETTIGLTDVTIEYSRPQMRGRTIFAADGLVPYGSIWRTGANQATKVTFSEDVMIGGNEVEAGSYAVLSKPMASSWEIMMFPYESGSWNSYVEKTPAVTVTATPQKTGGMTEAFTIDVQNYTNEGADIILKWADTMVAIPVSTKSDEQVMASIDRVMAGPSMNDYYAAASYLSDTDKDNAKALEYIQKANQMAGDNPRYWMLRREALVLNKLGRNKEAVAKAKQSMELAREAGNMDYVRLNEQSVKEWMK